MSFYSRFFIKSFSFLFITAILIKIGKILVFDIQLSKNAIIEFIDLIFSSFIPSISNSEESITSF